MAVGASRPVRGAGRRPWLPAPRGRCRGGAASVVGIEAPSTVDGWTIRRRIGRGPGMARVVQRYGASSDGVAMGAAVLVVAAVRRCGSGGPGRCARPHRSRGAGRRCLRPGPMGGRRPSGPRGPQVDRRTNPPRCGSWPGRRPGSAATTRPLRSIRGDSPGADPGRRPRPAGPGVSSAGGRPTRPRGRGSKAIDASPVPPRRSRSWPGSSPGPSPGGGGPGRRASSAGSRAGRPGGP